MSEVKLQIQSLIKKAANAGEPDHAVAYSQAAANCAAAAATMAHVGQHLS